MKRFLFSKNTTTSIRNLFFPYENIEIKPIGKLSPEVCVITLKNKTEYIGKLYLQSKYSDNMLKCMQQWNEKINETSGICSPKYIKSINGDYFTTITIKNGTYYICLMPRIAYVDFDIKNINDYRELGRSLALLHKAAMPLIWKSGKIFDFSYTNTEVESYWELQDNKEKQLFNRILKMDKYLKFDNLFTQITHNDIHPENMLQFKGKLLFIDFDQMLIGPRVNDIGQAVSAFRLDENISTFKKSIELVLDGYIQILPLSMEEIHSIPYFALRKLCISYVWFKGHANKNNRKAYRSYRIIRDRAFALGKYLELI